MAIWLVALHEGRTHTGPDGFRWSYGKPREMSDTDPFFPKYQNNPRFSMKRKEEDRVPDGSPKRSKSRAEIAAERAEQAEQRRRAEEDEALLRASRASSEDEDPEDEDSEDEDPVKTETPPAPAPSAPASKGKSDEDKRKAQLMKDAKRAIPKGIKREAADLLAHRLGIENPSEVESLPELLKLITQRQGEILAAAQSG